jgi:Anti-sigma-K factor rskA
MSEDQAVYEMMAAFAAGCMDKENFIQVKEYLDQGGELPERQLGEFQNIVAMIPIILEFEKPAPEIKDHVAKKLISMKDEIKAKMISDKRQTSATFTRASILTKTGQAPKLTKLNFSTLVAKRSARPTTVPDHEIEKNLKINGDILKQSRAQTRIAEESIRINKTPEFMEQPQSIISPKIPTIEASNTEQDKNISGAAAGWIAILLSIILFSALGYYSFSSIESIRKQNEELKGETTSLRSSLNSVNGFITNYNALLEFFNYKDIIVVNLRSDDPGNKASVKLLLSFGEKEGLIQFHNAKAILPNQTYQVWMINKGTSYSLGVYQPGQSEYLKITSFPFLPKEQIDSFRVTIEAGGGANVPSQNVYLSGSINDKKKQ